MPHDMAPAARSVARALQIGRAARSIARPLRVGRTARSVGRPMRIGRVARTVGRPMRIAALVVIAALTAGLGAGCDDQPTPPGVSAPPTSPGGTVGTAGATNPGGAAGPGGTADPAATATYGPDVVHLGGVRDIRFGDSQRALTMRRALVQDLPDCGPRLVDAPKVSPIFVDDRLVVLWADSPMHTPEGLRVGSALDRVRAAYPDLTRLRAPAGAYRFDGLLAIRGDRSYLFLHDSRTVKKLIVGFVEYAKLLFDQGYSAC